MRYCALPDRAVGAEHSSTKPGAGHSDVIAATNLFDGARSHKDYKNTQLVLAGVHFFHGVHAIRRRKNEWHQLHQDKGLLVF